MVTTIAFAQGTSAIETNNTKDWLAIEVTEPGEKICDAEDWLCIEGCGRYAKPDEESREDDSNETIEKDECYPWKAIDFEDKDNLLHIGYFMRQPKAAVAIIAFVSASMNKNRVKDVFVYKNLSFGLDPRAEEYYVAILQVHNATGFSRSEYPPNGLTIEQAKEIFYIDSDQQAMFWLEKERNINTGRLYYYILLGIYHSWLHSEDAGSAIAIIKDAESNANSIIKIDPLAYQLATVAYFHGTEAVKEGQELPTDELEQVEIILEKAKADKSETLPTPSPTPRHKYNYWENK